MSRSISYTSSSEGITIGVTGDSFAQCLAMLVDEFGEGMVPLYEKARLELTSVSESVEAHHVAQPAIPRVVDEVKPEVVPGEGEPVTEGVVTSDASSGSQETVDADAGSNDSDERGSRTDASDGATTDTEGATCSICGASITNDRATASLLINGDVRCSSCSI